MKSKFSILTALLIAADSMSAAVLIDGIDKESSVCQGSKCEIDSSKVKQTNDSEIVLNDCTHQLIIKSGTNIKSIVISGSAKNVLDNLTIEQNVSIDSIENQVRIKQMESSADNVSFTNAQNAVVEQGILISKGIFSIINDGIIQNNSAGQIGFGNQSPKANIKSWAITLNSNAADFNSLKNANTQNPSAFGHISVQGLSDGTLQNNNRGTILVENGAIKVGVGSGFVPGEKYEIKNVIVDLDKNQAAEASAINNGAGLKAANFAPASPSLNLTITDSDISSTNNTGGGGSTGGGTGGGGTNNTGGSGNTGGNSTGGGTGGSAISVDVSPLNSPAAQSAKAAIAASATRSHFIGNVISGAVSSVQTQNFSRTRASLDSIESAPQFAKKSTKEEQNLNALDHYAAAIADNIINISQNSQNKNLAQDYLIVARPYFTRNEVDSSPSNLSGNSYGIMVGAQRATNYGIFGLFAGYESGKLSGGATEQKNDDIYFGASYQKDFMLGIHPAFVSFMSYYATQDRDLSIVGAPKTKIKSGQFTTQGTLGLSFGNIKEKGVITPELNLEWANFRQKDYKLAFTNSAEEHYKTISHNFYYVGTTLNYEKELSEQFSLNASLGVKFSLDRKVKTSLNIAGVDYNDKINYPGAYTSAHLGGNFALNENTNIGLNYDGTFSSTDKSHSIWANFNFYF